LEASEEAVKDSRGEERRRIGTRRWKERRVIRGKRCRRSRGNEIGRKRSLGRNGQWGNKRAGL